jgi:hypothetical protein
MVVASMAKTQLRNELEEGNFSNGQPTVESKTPPETLCLAVCMMFGSRGGCRGTRSV